MSEGIRDLTALGEGREGRTTQALEETELHGSAQILRELPVKHQG